MDITAVVVIEGTKPKFEFVWDAKVGIGVFVYHGAFVARLCEECVAVTEIPISLFLSAQL